MNNVISDQDTDQFVWSLISTSTNPNDYLNFIKHAYNREVDHEQAFQLAIQYSLNADAPSVFPSVIKEMSDRAFVGDATACFHLARWCRLGIGTEINFDQALSWYQCGIDLGSTRCMISMARIVGAENNEKAVHLLTQAVELGDTSAYCFLADFDKLRHDELLELGAQSQDGFAIYSWGYHLLKTSTSDEERARAIEILSRAAKLGQACACNVLGVAHSFFDLFKRIARNT
jgi:TPR repeat protein